MRKQLLALGVGLALVACGNGEDSVGDRASEVTDDFLECLDDAEGFTDLQVCEDMRDRRMEALVQEVTNG